MKWQGTDIIDFIIIGDQHGEFSAIKGLFKTYSPNMNAVIILGDAGFNFYLNKTDQKRKEEIQELGGLVYCVRGNHEERPENIASMELGFDEIVNGYVYYEPKYSNIRYFIDGSIYDLIGFKTLVIGGAYSVDKEYRLIRSGKNPEEHWTGWFKSEQLTQEEMDLISDFIKGRTVDFVLSHTCPRSWQPFDLFLSQIDQKKIDKSMENWLDDLRLTFKWNVAWLFGHFHDDRIVRPHVEMYYKKSDSLAAIWQRWRAWDNGYKLDWWLKLDPNYCFWNEEQDKRKLKEGAFSF